MKIHNIRFGLATNSSSTHSLIFIDKPTKSGKQRPLVDSGFDGEAIDEFGTPLGTKASEFGWQFFTAASEDAKRTYLSIALYTELNRNLPEDIAEMICKSWAGAEPKGYIDHQSVWTFPKTFDGKFIHKQFFDELKEFVLQKNLVILGGNDNTTKTHPYGRGFRLPIPHESRDNWVARKDEKYGFWTLFNRDDGTKIRFSFDDKFGFNNEEKIPKKASTPELCDVKLTNFCPFGCEWCYQDSTKEGKHGDISYINKLIYKLKELECYEIACLSGNTVIFSPKGAVFVNNLKIGDIVYDSNGSGVKIKNIIKSRKNVIRLIGSKGWRQVVTPDHPFIVDGKIVEAKDLIGKRLDQIKCELKNDDINEIDLTPFINKRKEKRGSNPGVIIGDFCRLCHNSIPVKTKIKLNKDLMYLYGLSVAEGSSRGIALNANEQDVAEDVIAIYSSILNIANAGTIRKTKANAICVEFVHSKIYRSIFFDAMKIGYGAKNKSIKFLFEINDKSLISSALEGMFVGDGCVRKRFQYGCNTYSLSYKTASKILAEELCYLIYAKFGAYAYIYEGISPDRFIEGRKLNSSKYYMVEVHGKTNIEKIFPNTISSKDYNNVNTSKYSANKNKNYIEVSGIEDAGIEDVYDITLDDNSTHIFTLQHGVLTHNCGGGECTMHPNFIDILKLTRNYGIIPNFTTRDLSWLRDPKRWNPIMEYCGAFAVSCSDAKQIKQLAGLLEINNISEDKATIHIVMGTVSEYTFKDMLEVAGSFGFRVTLLGYKTNGRGGNFNITPYDWWIEATKEVRDEGCYVRVGIDTALASQYEKEIKAAQVPDVLFHTEEGKFSAYIDVVQQKIGPSSYCSEDKMVELKDMEKFSEIFATF